MASPTRPQLTALTSARFFAAFHVLLFHSWAMQGLTWAPGWLRQFASAGYVAVTFFFMLSGFILVYTYAGERLNVRRFWRARLARLYPVYLLSLLLTGPFFFYAVLKLDVPYFAYFKTHLASTSALVITLLQAWVPMAALGWNGPAWAVSVEIAFYALFPFLLARFSRISSRGLAALVLGAWTLVIAVDLTYVVLRPDHVEVNSSTDFLFWLSAIKFHPLMRLPEFMAGMACGYWFVRGGRHPKLATPLVLGGTAVALLTTALSRYIPYPVMHTGLFAPAFAAIIYGLALRPRWTSFLEGRWLALLGGSSYCFYLLHVVVLGMFFFSDPQHAASLSVGRWFCAAATATLVGVLVFRFVEEPARKRLRGRPAPSPLAVSAA
ncbi:MAG TPA: acyltransferase [Terriglobia bacterium]|nr:acyltransferase [Terriglobia bacterium]